MTNTLMISCCACETGEICDVCCRDNFQLSNDLCCYAVTFGPQKPFSLKLTEFFLQYEQRVSLSGDVESHTRRTWTLVDARDTLGAPFQCASEFSAEIVYEDLRFPGNNRRAVYVLELPVGPILRCPGSQKRLWGQPIIRERLSGDIDCGPGFNWCESQPADDCESGEPDLSRQTHAANQEGQCYQINESWSAQDRDLFNRLFQAQFQYRVTLENAVAPCNAVCEACL